MRNTSKKTNGYWLKTWGRGLNWLSAGCCFSGFFCVHWGEFGSNYINDNNRSEDNSLSFGQSLALDGWCSQLRLRSVFIIQLQWLIMQVNCFASSVEEYCKTYNSIAGRSMLILNFQMVLAFTLIFWTKLSLMQHPQNIWVWVVVVLSLMMTRAGSFLYSCKKHDLQFCTVHQEQQNESQN